MIWKRDKYIMYLVPFFLQAGEICEEDGEDTPGEEKRANGT